MISIVFRFLNSTLGVLVRLIENFKINKPVTVQVESVYDLVLKRSRIDSADYVISSMPEALFFNSRESLWRYCVNIKKEKGFISTNDATKPLLLEFGVFEGRSLKYFKEIFNNAEIHGFDSFQGLEEDWYGYISSKGTFNLSGKIPKFDQSIKIHNGWFEDTLPNFVKSLNNRQVDILHCDADTYKPTFFILNSLVNNLKSGSIIIFDEYFGYPSWRMHEFRAWKEFCNAHNIKYKYIGYSIMQVAVEIVT